MGKIFISDIVMGAVTILLFSTMFIAMGFEIKSCLEHRTNINYIESASMGSEVSGSFGLFAGTVDEVQFYFYYVEKGDGIILEKITAENTVIIETNQKEPQIHRIKCENNKLYVPPNTVMLDYNVRQPGLN